MGRLTTSPIALLLIVLGFTFAIHAAAPVNAPPVIDGAKLAARGIRKLTGTHLVLYTDLPSQPEIDVLPQVFDQAMPQWCRYLGIDATAHADWRVSGFLMNDAKAFDEAGLLPAWLPPFSDGFCSQDLLWIRRQRSDYYQRHLLLHEGTHSIMLTLLGSCGPPWYTEGLAEMLATHRWRDGRLTLGIFPARSEEVPMLRRIEALRKAVAAGRMRTLGDVLAEGPRGKNDAENYGWCWALAALLEGDPAYRERFRQLPRLVKQPDFNRQFEALFAADRGQLSDQWQVFMADLEYGADLARSAIQFKPGQPLPPNGAKLAVAADRGWQSSGLRLEAGQRYALRAAGRYQVASQPQIWWCEPGGVSIRYYHGRPLGQLLGAVRPDEGPVDSPTPLLQPIPIGLSASLEPKQTGTLYLRINDSAAELGDNAGELSVRITPERASSPAAKSGR